MHLAYNCQTKLLQHDVANWKTLFLNYISILWHQNDSFYFVLEENLIIPRHDNFKCYTPVSVVWK